ncbi:MAG: polyphosphate kinase 1 [Candidatus Latescibacterota bacterium]|nr:MAG: polyphosphate kinase 1 [Candidatus Latescibacterota bacterium]
MAGKNNHIINREISWLSFNERVLQEADDPDVPLLERLKFIGIFSSNLDEFFRVRVSSLRRMLEAGIYPKSVYGGSPRRVLKRIHKVVVKQRERFDKIFLKLERELEQENIFIVNESELNEKQERFVHDYFQDQVRPALVPIMLDTVPKFPYLENQVIYLAIWLSKRDKPGSAKYALIEVPTDVLPRFIVLPKVDDRNCVIMLDDVIRYGLKDIFSVFAHDDIGAYTVKITRDAELDIDDDVALSTLEKISKSLKQRRSAQAVRFVYDRDIPQDLLSFVLRNANLTKLDNVIAGGRYHNARDFMNFPNVGATRLRYKTPPALHHPQLDAHRSMFDAVKERDVLLHFPYQSFHHLTDLLREAAIDPKVRSIKITLYRVAKHSTIVNALINAVRNGKKVTVLLELQARFDEEANIYWTGELKKAGARVLSGVPGLKVHSKLCMITRKEGQRLVDYALVGTGNYHEGTAQIYTDHVLLTADKRITTDVRKTFEFLKDNYRTHNYKQLIVSPFFTRKRFAKLIRREIQNAKTGKEAYMYGKLNGLVDRKMIDKLYAASQAGVKIRLIVRGICSLIPGVKGVSDNVEVISIVDKYLEHSRIFVFCNNGDEEVYISSADWMTRNLDHRVEISTPIHDEALREELKHYLEIQFQDSTKARVINKTQNNQTRANAGTGDHRAQFEIYDWLRRKRPQ